MTGEDAPDSGVRGRILDWAWHHPRVKRRMREAWGIERETAGRLGFPRLFEPPEWAALRRLATTTEPPDPGAERILFMSWRGWSTHLAIETVLAHAVQRRGGAPIFAYCGGRLPICDVMPVNAAPPMPCHSCREYARGAIGAAGFDSIALHDVMDVGSSVRIARKRTAGLTTVSECEAFVDQDLPLGRLVRTSVAWFLSRGTLSETPEVVETYRSFIVSGLVTARGLRSMLERTGAQRVFMLNGTFFAESIMSGLAAQRDLPFGTYEKGFIRDSIVMTPGEPASQLMVPAAAWEEARDAPLTPVEAEAVDEYLNARRYGGGALDNFWLARHDDSLQIRGELRLDVGRSLAVMFCNILWDSAVLGRDLAFPSMGEWVASGIRWAQSHPDTDLVIRIHPAEVGLRNHPTRERMADHIAATFSELPPNVRVIEAGDPTSSYVLMDEATVGLVYTSTVGLELAARGVPVVVAANTHYRGRGFTIDPTGEHEYWLALDRLLQSPPNESERQQTRELARRYAALFFFRFQNVMYAVHEEGRSRPEVRVARASELDPGRDPAIDRIVSGILEGVPPIAPRAVTRARVTVSD